MGRSVKRQYSPGRWQTERERHRILEEEAPSVAEGESPVAEVIASVVRRLDSTDRLWIDDIEAAWPGVVGAAVAAHSRPGRYERGVLVVFVDSSVQLSELSRYSQKRILSNLQKRFGAERIRAIRLQLDPDGRRTAR